MAFQRDGAICLKHLHQLGGQRDRVDMVLLVMLRALEDLHERAADRLQVGERVAGDGRADRRAADDHHFIGQRVQHRAHRPAADDEAAEDQDQQNDDADNRVHDSVSP